MEETIIQRIARVTAQKIQSYLAINIRLDSGHDYNCPANSAHRVIAGDISTGTAN